MKDPMPDLQTVINASRGGDDPLPEDRARLRAALALKLGAAAFAATASVSASAAGAAGAKVVTATIARYLVALALTGAAGAGAVATHRSLTRPQPIMASHPRTTPAPPRARPAVTSPAASPLTVTAPVAPVAPATTETPTLAPRPRAAPARSDDIDAVPLEEAHDLRAETAALRDAHAAMEGNDPERALAVLQSYASEHPGGAMRIEREGARLIALCRLGRERELDVTSFLTHRASSPLAARVAIECHRR